MARSPQVLLFDQDAPPCGEIADHLKQAGYCVTLAASGEEGLEILYQVHPDLIFMDLKAPPDAGWEMLARIRLFTDTQAIVRLNEIAPCDVDRAAALGHTELIQDSVSPDQWMVAVKKQLAHRPRLPKRRKIKPAPSLTLKNIKLSEILQVDRALAEVGEWGEVHLIKDRGQLRYIVRVKTESQELLP